MKNEIKGVMRSLIRLTNSSNANEAANYTQAALNLALTLRELCILGEETDEDDSVLSQCPSVNSTSNTEDINASLLNCASDLQHSAFYAGNCGMQSCMRDVAKRIDDLVAQSQNQEEKTRPISTSIIGKEALAGSILKWKKIVTAFEINPEAPVYEENGSRNCPLCQVFNNPLFPVNNPLFPGYCTGCPVKLDTNRSSCVGTPYDNWFRDRTKENAQAMLEYLVDLNKRTFIRDFHEEN